MGLTIQYVPYLLNHLIPLNVIERKASRVQYGPDKPHINVKVGIRGTNPLTLFLKYLFEIYMILFTAYCLEE